MKKILSILCAAALMTSLAACTGDKPSEASSSSSLASSSKVSSTKAPESGTTESSKTSAADTGIYDTMEAFIASVNMQDEIKEQQDALKGTGMAIEISGSGNKLFYDFTVENEALSAAMDAEKLKESIGAQADTFKVIAGVLKAAVKVENPVVVVRYLDHEGKEIYAIEFTADNTPEVKATEAPKAEGEPTSTGTTDISSAIDAKTTTEANPVPVGQWVKVPRYATEDQTYHPVYVRITKVTTSTENKDYVDAAIKLHNENSYDFNQIDPEAMKLPADVELCTLDYEVFVPEDFPTPEHGIVTPDFDFSQDNIGGGGIPAADGSSTYIGLGNNVEALATEKEPVYTVGNTYALRSLFTMVKGYTGYVNEFTTYEEGTKELTTENMYHVYFDHK